VVTPELVLPYAGGWYLVGYCEAERRVVMLCLDTVAEVCVANAPVLT
jgi:hypothetical protein